MPCSPGTDLEAEAARIDAASAQVSGALFERAAEMDGDRRAIVETTAALAMDPAILDPAKAAVVERRLSAERAVWEAADHASETLRAAGGYAAERAADVRDVCDRLIAALSDAPVPGIPDLTEPSILVANDLSPVETAGLDVELVRAFVTAQGGPSSHTAILARGLGIPAIVALPDALDMLPSGTLVIVDGATGAVEAGVTEQTVEEVVEEAAAAADSLPHFSGAGATADGHAVRLYANVGSITDAKIAAEAGAEGIGLLRTEIVFLDRAYEPSVEEQTRLYTDILAPFAGRPVVVRTLDAGADKPMPFVTPDEEPNPALGVRGLRTARRFPEVLDNQLAAIAAAARASGADVRVMAPMVATLEEVTDFVQRARRHGLTEAGVMVETPAAAIMADTLLAEATFASIGTNDLVQYAMAADRQVGALADLSTPWQPAALRLVRSTCRGADQQGRTVGVCGEAAADPALAVVLTGLGVSSLSMGARAIDAVAAVLGATSLAECRRIAGLALGCDGARAAQFVARENLPILAELGL